ncbi:MAG: tetratricopeptide repeat protein [bacterium]
MKSYLTLICVSICFGLLFSCSTLPTNSNPKDEVWQQADLLTTNGQKELYLNQTEKAISSFLSAYNFLLLSDYSKEKLVICLLLADSYKSINDTINYYYWLNSAKMLSVKNNLHKPKMLLFDLKQLFKDKDYSHIIYAKQTLNISNFNDEEMMEILSYVMLSKYFTNNDYSKEFQLLIDLNKKMNNLYIENDFNNLHILSYVCYNLGFINYYANNLTTALDYFEKSLEYDSLIENYMGAAENLFNIANIYKKQNNFEKAIYYFSLSSDIFNIINNKDSYYKTRLSALELLFNSEKSKSAQQEINQLKELLKN